MSSPSEETSNIKKNKPIQAYYGCLESRIGYELLLGGTRHFGLYAQGSYWPFSIDKALRAMEDHLIITLALKKGSRVLDAGCGAGHVAIHLARDGYRVHAIDVLDHHLVKARRNIKAASLEGTVTATTGDYHHLEVLSDESFDGAYTMETFVHATDLTAAAAELFRVLRPGGSHDHIDYSGQKEEIRASWEEINQLAAMPAYSQFKQGC